MPKNKEFDPQTWFKIDRHYAKIEPLPGIVKATRTTATRREWRDGKNGPYAQDCVYRRTEVFPTYTEAADALAKATEELKEEYSRKATQAVHDFKKKQQLHDQAVFTQEAAQTTPNPDAIIGSHNWVYFITSNALNTAKTIQPLEGDTLTDDSYRTIKPDNAQHFANELRKLGLTVAE